MLHYGNNLPINVPPTPANHGIVILFVLILGHCSDKYTNMGDAP
jgi:hypothetical protein